MNKLYFVMGDTANYSMGMPVYVCFTSLFFHFIIVFGIIIVHRRTIEKRKMFSIIIFMLIIIGLLFVQMINPEVLMTSLVQAFSVISIYINFEDPSLRRIRTYNSDIVDGFATLVENRDNSTGGHIRRTKEYVRIILNVLWKNPKYHHIVTKDYVRNVLNAAPMHDIGKISTPDYILQKPGGLTDDEYSIMKEHAAIGGDIILKTFEDLDDEEYKRIAYDVARYHHEKWNGKGYPDGLSGEDIPLHARIMSIADVFDAVSSKRCYRDAMPLEKCFKIIEEGAGTDFDPELVPLFLGAKSKIIDYYNKSKKKDNDLS